jgi:hypothetical protein
VIDDHELSPGWFVHKPIGSGLRGLPVACAAEESANLAVCEEPDQPGHIFRSRPTKQYPTSIQRCG